MNKGEFEKLLEDIEYKDWKFIIGWTRGHLYLQASHAGYCNETAVPLKWKSRKWLVSPHMTKSELVQTALKAVLTAEEHEIRENFAYKGESIFDPHYDVDELHKLRRSAVWKETRKQEN